MAEAGPELTTDILVVGAGGAGMYAALAAAREGLRVLLLEKSLPGRSGATVMAQMTVAAALGHEEPDHWSLHFEDSIKAGHAINRVDLTRIMCREAPERVLELAEWGTRWAQNGDRYLQVAAPGHSRRRCIWAGTLATGLSITRALRGAVEREAKITSLPDTFVTDLLVDDGTVRGVLALDLRDGRLFSIAARAVILATGGCTDLFQRTTASRNMTGDGYWLGLRAGAELLDMEFIQFFPIGNLYPPLPGFDPVMWDPFRYKLGGRLRNARGEDFLQEGSDEGRRGDEVYRAPRDVVAKAILTEVAEGRGSPHGGVYLDFTHIPRERLVEAFGPVIKRLEQLDVDLTRSMVEVAPIAHYTMGGLLTDAQLQTSVKGLFGTGEAVGGAHGANRLSGNGITEAITLGHAAGRFAAAYVREGDGAFGKWPRAQEREARYKAESVLQEEGTGPTPGALLHRLKQIMWEGVGPFRNEQSLRKAREEICSMRSEELPRVRVPDAGPFNLAWVERIELEGMLEVAETVILAAERRKESRGSHQREDFPRTDPTFLGSTAIVRRGESLETRWLPVPQAEGTSRSPGTE